MKARGAMRIVGWRPGHDANADRAFDAAYPAWARRHSEQQWTPVQVARRAAELLVTNRCMRVLDVGAGAGKFCIVGALATGARFFGIEQRADLVDIARDAARCYGVQRRVELSAGDITSVDWRDFDAFYLYNPFLEYSADAHRPCRAVGMATRAREECVRFTRSRLALAPVGTRVVTYYGFGGDMPRGYRCLCRERWDGGFVELWVKEARFLVLPPFERFSDRGDELRSLSQSAGANTCV